MRDYAKVSPQFWIGETGKKIRMAGAEAQVIALYLMTGPHANMLGLYYVPKLYIAHETGLGMEGACKGLERCIEAGFCSYDETSEMVWVHEMASYQIADALLPTDKRSIGVQNEYNALPANPYLALFFEKYAAAFNMTKQRGQKGEFVSPSEAPSKPLGSQEQEQEQEQDSLSGKPDVLAVLKYLNVKTKRDYRPVDSNTRLIAARLKEGATVAECKAVIDAKVKKWAGDAKMDDFLRPKTLFNATNFAQYVGELPSANQSTGGVVVDGRFKGAK